MSKQHAYSTDNPETVGAYRQAAAAYRQAGKRIAAGIKELGAGPRAYVRHSGFPGTRDELTAIEQCGEHIPEGWRVVRGKLEPRRGKPGEVARQWLAEHQPVDVRHVMEKRGLPRAAWIPRDGEFGWMISSPKLFEHDGTLWACYEGEPGAGGSGFDTDKCAWTPRKLSEFHAALESHDAAEAVSA